MSGQYEIRERPASLPPLRVKRKDARAKLDHDKYAKSLFSLRDTLVTSDFVKLMDTLCDGDRPTRGHSGVYLRCFSDAHESAHHDLRSYARDLMSCRGQATYHQFLVTWMLSGYSDVWSDVVRKTEAEDPGFREKWRSMERDVNERLLTQSKDESDRLQDLVSGFEENNGVSLDILETTTVFVCRQCNRQALRGKFKKAKCDCGGQIASLSDVEQVPLAALAPAVQAIWTENMWLEEGIAYQFRAHRYEAESGLQVLGGSGGDHEIDVIAQRGRPPTRIFCECKHREIKPNHVLVFAGKVRDIGGQAAMMFTTATSVDDRVRRLARANGIQVVDSVLDKPAEEWATILI